MLEGIDQNKIIKLVRTCINAIGTPELGPVKKHLRVTCPQRLVHLLS